MSWMILDSDEDGYETESDPTPTLGEAPTVEIAKRKREVSTSRIFALAPGSRTETIVLQDYNFRIESKQKAEGIAWSIGSTA